MLPCNKNVSQGQANGTQATIEKVALKPGEMPGCFAWWSDPKYCRLTKPSGAYCSEAQQCSCPASDFLGGAKETHFYSKHTQAKIRLLQMKGDEREKLDMKGIQLPLFVNNATTGHKLQGSGMDLSKYAVPDALKGMMDRF